MSSSSDQASASSTSGLVSASSPSKNNKKMVVLCTNDDESFEVESSIATKESATINHVLDSDCGETAAAVPLPNITGPVLARVLEFWNRRNDPGTLAEEKRRWEAEFVKGLKKDELFDVILAANYLDSKALLDVTCQAVADEIKSKPVEEVREYFDIEDDFTAEEKEKIMAEKTAGSLSNKFLFL